MSVVGLYACALFQARGQQSPPQGQEEPVAPRIQPGGGGNQHSRLHACGSDEIAGVIRCAAYLQGVPLGLMLKLGLKTALGWPLSHGMHSAM
jgi:hypothetical protein